MSEKYDLFRHIHQAIYTADFTRDGQEMQQTYETTNYYLLGYKTPPDGVSIIGGKTGTTDNAGLCLILYVEDGSGNGYISFCLVVRIKILYSVCQNYYQILANKHCIFRQFIL